MIDSNFLKKFNINLNNLCESDFDNIVDIYFKSDEDIQELFLNNFYYIVKYYIDKHSYLLKDQDSVLYKKLFTYVYCLYGKDKIDIFKFSKDNGLNVLNDYIYSNSNNLTYLEKSNNHLLEPYLMYIYLENKYRNISKETLKEAFYIVFGINNLSERYEYKLKLDKFLKKHNITKREFFEYVQVYGFKYTNKKDKIDLLINSRKRLFSFRSTISNEEFKKILRDILNTDNIQVLKNIIYENHISISTINFALDNKNEYKDFEKYRDVLIKKVEIVIKKLEEEYKYVEQTILLSKLEKIDDEDIIYKIIKNNYNMTLKINDFVSYYRGLKSYKEQQELVMSLKNKVKKAKRKCGLERKTETDTTKHKELLELYDKVNFQEIIDKDITLKEFCEINNFTGNKYNKLLDLLKANDLGLYQKVKTKLLLNQKKYYLHLKRISSKIEEYIVNGITLEDGSNREFDIVDYYFISSYSYEQISDFYSKNYSTKDALKLVKSFFKKYSNYKYISEQTALNLKVSYMVDNQLHEVTQDEKLSTIEYLKKHNIPLYNTTYSCALRRNVFGTLYNEVDDNKNLLKKS